jgi:signal transduction histidine kinase
MGWRAAMCMAVLAALLVRTAESAAGSEPTTLGVLILHSNQRPTAAGIVIEDTLRSVVPKSTKHEVGLFSEYLDEEWAAISAYGLEQAEFLRQKYSARNIRAIVAAAPLALRFAVEFRDRMLPAVPIVHIAIPVEMVARMALPADVIGHPVDLDPTATLELALRLHPDARRIVMVLGAGERDRAWEKRLRAAVPRLERAVDVEYLAGLPTPEVLRRVAALPAGTVVFTPGFFIGRGGHIGTPRQSLELIAPASAVPVYSPVDTHLGSGIVGGHVTPYQEQAKLAGAVIARLLDGVPAPHLATATVSRNTVVDWRQVRRWGIDERLLPADTVTMFREPTVLENYWRETSIAIAVLLVQALLIAALLIERRSRQRTAVALAESQRQMHHVMRVSMAGQLSAAIAHQLNQPLAAILGNAEVAQRMLRGVKPDLRALEEICSDIVTEDQRAAEVIRGLNALYKKSEMKRERLELNELVRGTLELLHSELLMRHVIVAFDLGPDLPPIHADAVQLQQVVLNLVMNAADAMAAMKPEERKITICTAVSGAQVRLSVVDNGTGIVPASLETMFDAFTTTKTHGMGMGLAICRSIVALHEGTITAANNPERGAALHVCLPIAQATSIS